MQVPPESLTPAKSSLRLARLATASMWAQAFFDLAAVPSLGNTIIHLGPNTVLSGAGGIAIGFTANAMEQTLHVGAAFSEDFATKYIRRNAIPERHLGPVISKRRSTLICKPGTASTVNFCYHTKGRK